MTATLFASFATANDLLPTRVIRSWSDGRHDLGAYRDAISVLEKPRRSGRAVRS